MFRAEARLAAASSTNATAPELFGRHDSAVAAPHGAAGPEPDDGAGDVTIGGDDEGVADAGAWAGAGICAGVWAAKIGAGDDGVSAADLLAPT